MASRGVNKVILIGYLGQDPEVRYMTNGNPVTSISIATTESWKDKKTDEFKEKTEWHRVVLFGKLAEIASSYLFKGSQVYIEGSLRTRKWQNQDGQDRYITEIIVSVGGSMKILNNKSISDNKLTSSEHTDLEKSSDDFPLKQDSKITDDAVVNFDDEDIPF